MRVLIQLFGFEFDSTITRPTAEPEPEPVSGTRDITSSTEQAYPSMGDDDYGPPEEYCRFGFQARHGATPQL